MALADPMFWKPENVQLLLGIDACTQLLETPSAKLNGNMIQQNTKLGAIVMGSVESSDSNEFVANATIKEDNSKEIENLVRRFWEVEEVPLRSNKSKEHELVEKIFNEKFTRDKQGRFSVPIPLNPNVKRIGESRQIALKRFHILEKRFAREPEYRKQYVKFMREYEQLGHMIEVDHDIPKSDMVYYIPHHATVSSGSFKVVFDCSCKTDEGKSLNQVQLVGPKLQRDLFEIILRSRRHKIAMSVDVKKMFRQIRIIPEHWDLQRIFWRESMSEPLKEYWLVTVIYGQASSPTNAVMVMHKGAETMQERYPKAVEVIKNDFYMDDGFTGADSEKKAIQMARDLKTVFSTMGFQLDKGKSESIELAKELRGDQSPISIEEAENQSILGLIWDLRSREFLYRVRKPADNKVLTRRTVLAKVASLFDPLGHLAPVIFYAKLFVQSLWRKTKTWDEPISETLQKEWIEFWDKIECIEQVRIPRWLGTTENVKVELYGFCDASSKGFGAVIYVRTETIEGSINVIQLIAKSRVAPLNIVSIPRLELLAAVLLTKLLKSVQCSMEWENIPYFLYTDSKISIQWMHKEPIDLKTFVGNRVAFIRERVEISAWSHVRTKENPADLVSRGLMPDELAGNDLWWKGPKWLIQSKKNWPSPIEIEFSKEEPEMTIEMRVHAVQKEIAEVKIGTESGNVVSLLDYSNNLEKIQTIYAYALRFKSGFIERFHNGTLKESVRQGKRRQRKKLILLPSALEKAQAMKYLIKREQETFYAKELKGNMNKSKLEPLKPIRDQDGILRVGGRLKHASCPYEMKVPIILPPKSRLTWLIMHEAHETTKHGHVQVMMQYVRERYWIPRLRYELRDFVGRCVTCKRYDHPMGVQLMGDLPFDRVNLCKPFRRCGVDYAGPIEIRDSPHPRAPRRKVWIAVFVCLMSRAIHLDIVLDLTSAEFLDCFKRFVGRRGRCDIVYSDNATTFVGASKELKAALKIWYADETIKKISSFGTNWKFMTAGAPHQGGVYEAAVKKTKHHLRRVIGGQCWMYSQYNTLLIEIEAVLNSRPLYELSDDPNDMQALTPGHFLFGEAPKVLARMDPPPKTKYSVKKIWAEAQNMKENFWNRYLVEYLPTLQVRKKWTKENCDYEIGQLAVIKDENLAPAHWLMGRIVELIPSNDGLVRSVKLKTATGQLSRPVQKICILPVDSEGISEEYLTSD